MERHSINYGGNTIEYELLRKNIKNINLKVRPDLTVAVSAPKNVPHEAIEQFVKKKAHWITKNIRFFKETRYMNEEKEYVSGEAVYYLGRQYRLKVVKSAEDNINLSGGYIFLHVKNNDHKRKEKLLTEWLRGKAGEVFSDSLDRMYPKIQKYGIERPAIVIRKMKARWGSCSRDKKIITLNTKLLKAPKSCIDYVVLHELLHFKYSNHNRKFYDFLTTLMPDWKERKKLLDNNVAQEI